jgi:hypothetical protein
LRIVHFRNGALGVVDFFVHDVCSSAIDVEHGVHGHAKVFDDAIFAKDLADVGFFDVSGESFYYDLLQ